MRRQQGFTLIEVAIVIAVIGLLIGGVLMGRDLIRSAQLQSIVEDKQKYKQAVETFRDKYHYMPGDMPNATTFWGTDVGGCVLSYKNDEPKVATCDGNGDGFIGASDSDARGSGVNSWNEQYRAWQQLANAGMIPGSFSGAATTDDTQNLPNIAVPAGQYPGSLFSIVYARPGTASAAFFDSSYGHVIVAGAPVLEGQTTYNALFTATEARVLDQKSDDGMPGTGDILSFPPATLLNCASSNTSTATYLVTQTGPRCSLIFLLGM